MSKRVEYNGITYVIMNNGTLNDFEYVVLMDQTRQSLAKVYLKVIKDENGEDYQPITDQDELKQLKERHETPESFRNIFP